MPFLALILITFSQRGPGFSERLTRWESERFLSQTHSHHIKGYKLRAAQHTGKTDSPHGNRLRLWIVLDTGYCEVTVQIRWDEKAGLRRDAVGSQVIDVLEAQEIKETGNEEG